MYGCYSHQISFFVFLQQLTLTVLSCISLGAHAFILCIVFKNHSPHQRTIIVCSIYACPSIYTRAWCAGALGHYGEQTGVQLLSSICNSLLYEDCHYSCRFNDQYNRQNNKDGCHCFVLLVVFLMVASMVGKDFGSVHKWFVWETKINDGHVVVRY